LPSGKDWGAQDSVLRAFSFWGWLLWASADFHPAGTPAIDPTIDGAASLRHYSPGLPLGLRNIPKETRGCYMRKIVLIAAAASATLALAACSQKTEDSAATTVESAASDAAASASDAAATASDAAADAADTAKDAAGDAADKAKDAAGTAVDAAKDAADSAKKAVDAAADAVKH